MMIMEGSEMSQTEYDLKAISLFHVPNGFAY